jgi:hypothetical protein
MAVLALMDGQESRDAALQNVEPGDVLIGVGDRWLAAAGQGAVDFATIPGVLSFVDDTVIGFTIPDVDALLGDVGEATSAVASLLGVDAALLDEATVQDGMGWIMAATNSFQAEFDASSVTEPVSMGNCLDNKPDPGPPPPSTLRARRFAGDPVLEACLAGSHRMLAPEEGRAVMKVQAALIDLGFQLPASGADGKFGTETGAAVSAFKTQHNLQPTDPVVGRLTMGKLDELFADA